MINEFLDQYTKDTTKSAYRSAILTFLESIYGKQRNTRKVTHAEMLLFESLAEKYFKDNRDYGKDLQQFALSFKDKPPTTARLYLTGVKEFLITYNVNLTPQQTRIIKRSTPKGSSRTIETYLDQPTIRTIISHMDIKGRAMVLTLASGGMRIEELLQLSTEDIHLNEKPSRIDIRGNTSDSKGTKNSNQRFTFITSEAKETLIEWLKVRVKYIESSQNKNAGLIKARLIKDGLIKNGDIIIKEKEDTEELRLFPFSYGVADELFENALKRADLLTLDSETNRKQIHIHSLRKFFTTQLKLGIPESTVEQLTGHDGYMGGTYDKRTIQAAGELYLKSEHLLFINMPKDLIKIETEFKDQLGQNRKLLEDLFMENRIQKQQLEAQNTKLEFITKIIKETLHIDITKTSIEAELQDAKNILDKLIWTTEPK